MSRHGERQKRLKFILSQNMLTFGFTTVIWFRLCADVTELWIGDHKDLIQKCSF